MGAAVGALGALGLNSGLLARPVPARIARVMLVRKNSAARIAVVRVRRLAEPRAVIRLASLRPMPRPPPSLRWIRMVPIRAAARITWMTSRTVCMGLSDLDNRVRAGLARAGAGYVVLLRRFG